MELPAGAEGLMAGAALGVILGFALHLPDEMTGWMVLIFAGAGWAYMTGFLSQALDVICDVLDRL